ncbi:MAG: tsaE [Solirubrobacterales bacterium]|nr:tsaE [Solirubrobacterales bacterium]
MVTTGATHLSSSPAQTEALGAGLAAALRPGDIVLLYGEMGAGKTTFVRGALRALGNTGPVTSPTYTIARHYDEGAVPVAHLDLHRLGNLEDEDPAFLADHLDPRGIAFLEWPQIAADDEQLTGRVAARVRLEHVSPEERRVRIDP